MRKKILACVFSAVLSLSILSSCNEKNTNDNSSKENNIHNTLVCAIPDLANVSDDTIDEFNKLLQDKGCDFKLALEKIDLENYADELKKTDCDIAYTGFIGENNENYPLELIKEGYFECLDDYITKADWYKNIPDKMWNAIKYENKVYTIPNESQVPQGINIVFNLNKVSKEQIDKFNGNILDLTEIINEPNSIIYGIPSLYFSNVLGYAYNNGVVVSLDNKKAYNPYENKEIVNYLKSINDIYKKGIMMDVEKLNGLNQKADEDGKKHVQWSAYITPNLGCVDDKDIDPYIYPISKAIIETNYACTMGITSKSSKKEDAFKLLSLLHTDNDLGNLLIYGKGYQDIDGKPYDENGIPLTNFNNKLIFGISQNILKTDDGIDLQFKSAEEYNEYYNKQVIESPTLDLNPKGNISSIIRIEETHDILKSNDINKDLQTVKKELKKAGIDEVLTDVNRQLDEFYKQKNK